MYLAVVLISALLASHSCTFLIKVGKSGIGIAGKTLAATQSFFRTFGLR